MELMLLHKRSLDLRAVCLSSSCFSLVFLFLSFSVLHYIHDHSLTTMYIKSITIDGFKTYGRPVELKNFDPQFNAITGLNGTGKSNILDAICFVLGQSNPQKARVNTLKELIFKNGQAGVVKAKVSITFDNSNPKSCPNGFEQYPEILVTREINLQNRTKYYLNGFVAQSNQQIEDLFHSVQLNIKNPHFLIMQGRITTVLNMKPQEILGMVEEATGASRYEVKKKQCQNSIEKKDVALKAIDHLLLEQIQPNLDKLKTQMKGLNEFKKVSADLERNNKILTAWQFVQFQEKCQNTGTKVAEQKKLMTVLENDIENNKETIKEIQVTVVQKEKEKDDEFGGKLSRLEDQLKEMQLQESKAVTNLNNFKDTLNDINNKKKELQKQHNKEENDLKRKDKEYDEEQRKFKTIEDKSNEDAANLTKAQKDYEAISAGAARADDGDASRTLAEQLLSAKNEMATVQTEEKKAGMKIAFLKKELETKKKEVDKKRGSLDSNQQKYQVVEKEVEKWEKQLQSLGFDEEEYRQKVGQRKTLAREVEMIKREVEDKEYNSGARFNYTNPGGGFKEENIVGMVCQLFNVKDKEAMTALEVAAGGKLYNIVVKDTDTAKALINNGRLGVTRTFLPLDQMQGKTLDPQKLKNAERLVGKNNVRSALSLVGYDSSLEKAMRAVFSDTLICNDLETAKTVAFDKKIFIKCVTLDGDVVNPEGTMSGGRKNQGTPFLSKMEEVKERKQELEEKLAELRLLEDQLRSLDQQQKEYTKLKHEFGMKSRELEMLKESMANTSQSILREEITNMENELKTLENCLTEFPQAKKQLDRKIKELETKMKNSKSIREAELKEAEKILKEAQKKSAASVSQMEKKKLALDTLHLEIKDLIQGLENIKKELEEIEQKSKDAAEDVAKAQEEVNKIQSEVTAKKNKVNDQKKQLKSKSDEINKLHQKRDQLSKENETKKLEIRKLEHFIESIEKDSSEASKSLKHLIKHNPWIEEEKADFGNERAGYPFKKTDFDPGRIKGQIMDLQTKKAVLAKTVNMRANIALQDKEGEFKSVTGKRNKVEEDKKNLIQYMLEVDRKKKEELKNAFDTVNNHLGSIFKSLLPGSDAKLAAPSGKTIHDGLEIKVAFGGVWKESLTELSGGQRSLVALSLVLALLRYNPAPIYILDEVDAALDQSHTTNIGQMIKANFPDSQVSFKFCFTYCFDD